MNPSHSVLGSKGDFVTSPEISQVFGEILGIWFLSQYMQTGQSKPIRLIELGPGKGTLTADILRVLSQFNVSKPAVREIGLVETSPMMKGIQQGTLEQTLYRFGDSANVTLDWYDSLDIIPSQEDVFTMLVAHEFFDALPFHVLQLTEKGWHEVMITTAPDPAAPTIITHEKPYSSPLDVSSSNSPPRFRPVLSSEPSPSSTILGLSSPRFQKLPIGSTIEVSLASYKIAHQLGQLLKPSPEAQSKGSTGCALIVDYGGEQVYGNSFRGFKEHKIVDVFHRPGECDLTVNVDFTYLQEAIAPNATTLGVLTQAEFLNRMGLLVRVDALMKAVKDEERKKDIASAAKRLVDLTGMGSQYKIMGVSGLEEDDLSGEARWPFLDVLTPEL
ncbi:unnamed protein product [Somion occarium]